MENVKAGNAADTAFAVSAAFPTKKMQSFRTAFSTFTYTNIK